MNEETLNLTQELGELFEKRRFADLRIKLLDMEAVDIATFIEEMLSEKEQLVFFRLLPKELASDVFIEIDSDTQEMLIKAFTDQELKAVVDDMYLDDTVDVIEEMPANVVKRILKAADPEDRKMINELLAYPEDSAGSLMTPEFVSLSANMTVDDAFDKIRRTGVNKETIYTCYVTDAKKRLIGVLNVKDLLLSDKKELIENIMETSVVTLDTVEDKEDVALKFQKYDYMALPVIDKEGCIVGIVTVDDAVDVIMEEATEDMQKMAAITPTNKPYLKTSVWQIWLNRVPWLLVLMISATLTSMILSYYENSLLALSVGATLYAFVPMLMDTAGNAGNQASVTVVRAMALNEVEFKDTLKVLLKEFCASFFLGLSVAVVCFLKLMLVDNLYNDVTVSVALIVSGVLFVTIMMAKIVGCLLPLFAKKCRLDPAVVASPFVTTIVDALSLVIYCGVSIAILS